MEKVGNPGGPYYPYTASGTFLWKDYLCSNWDLATSGTAQAQNETVKEPFVACGGWTPYSNNPASNPYAEAGAVLVSLCGSGKYFSYGHHWAYRIGAWREDYSNSGTVTI